LGTKPKRRISFDFFEGDHNIRECLVSVRFRWMRLMVSMPGENQPSSHARRVATNGHHQRIGPTALGLSAAEAAALLGVSESHFYSLHRTGRLGPLPVRMGRAVRWSRKELVDWFEAGSPSRSRWLALRAANN
jgi:excisionase family DNA binding protein